MNSEIEKSIASAFKERRLSLGLSVRQLSSISGISGATIYRIEDHQHSPSAKSIYSLCCSLRLTPNEVFPEIKNYDYVKTIQKVEV